MSAPKGATRLQSTRGGDDDKPEMSNTKKKAAAEAAEEIELAKATGEGGLSSSEAERAFKQWGPNELAEKKISPLMQFLGYLWGPMPIMIWIAILVELIKGSITNEGWEDFGVLMFLQFANAIVGYYEESNAGDAIAALKAKLAPQCHLCRNGKWETTQARGLVPGDLIELKIGDVVPADSILRVCKPIQVDQAALTGESLPVIKSSWEKLLMGSAIKQGEAHAVVVATGPNTFFGRTAGLIGSVVTHGRLQLVLLRITASLLVLSAALCIIIFAVLYTSPLDIRALERGEPRPANGLDPKAISAISTTIVILVASIPVAIEIVCTSTLALGSRELSEKGIIVARLSAIEELAGMTVLCSDKTGTLTKNKLELQQPIVLSDAPPCDLVFYGALASKRSLGNQDAIDFAICDAKSNRGLLDDALQLRGGLPLTAFRELDFEPFNPTDKRTMATILMPDGTKLEVAKGAPMVILRMAHNKDAINDTVRGYVQDLADRGFRALGVCINLNPPDAPTKCWEYLGILSIFDPPRDDTKATIAAAIDSGVMVKMVTGDHGAIARETCRTLGMGTNILNTDTLNDTAISEAALDDIIMACDGFAEVMPEHKFKIVERIRAKGHVTGMTGDGVNDAPALKRADVGIAVAGATDAARAAADLVLTEEGLSVIIDAIFASRMIFQRMRNYIIYRIACTIQLLLFFFIVILAVKPDDPYYYGGVYCLGLGSPVQGGTFGHSINSCRLDIADEGQKDCNGKEWSNTFYSSSNFTQFAGLKETDPIIGVNGGNLPLPNCPYNAENRAVAYGAFSDNNPLAHGSSFTLPVISLVLITILNDGCMITISQDLVVPEKKPQYWMLKEATIVALVLGWIACLSSIFLLVGCMHSNYLRQSAAFEFIGSNGHKYLTWFEIRTIIYLKVSISDFLTLFSARTRTWFWERRVGKALGIAACVALTTSTIFALFWDKMFAGLGRSAFMAGLSNSKGAAFCTWLYCILWWLIQDVAKVITYWYLDRRAALMAPKEVTKSLVELSIQKALAADSGHGHGGGHGSAVKVDNPLSKPGGPSSPYGNPVSPGPPSRNASGSGKATQEWH